MPLLIVLVFLAVFAVIAPLAVWWSGAGKAAANKQVIAALDSALGDKEKEKPAPVIDFRKVESFSNIPWLNKILSRIDLIPRLQKTLNQAEVKWTPGMLLLMSAACMAVPGYLVYLRTGSIILGFLIGAALAFLPLSYVLIKRGQRFKKFEAGLPDALDLMTSALRVGHSFNSALSLVSRECADPIGSEFRTTFEEQNFGLPLRDALLNLSERVPVIDVRFFVTALLIQKETGGNLAEILDGLSRVIRDRFRIYREIQVRTAQGRLTAGILIALPIFMAITISIINPNYMNVLFEDPKGPVALAIAGGLQAIGSMILWKIIHFEV